MAYYGYDRDKDYMKLMTEAAKQGNMLQAAVYEAQRNEKIDGEKLQYEKTNLYGSYLPGSAGNSSAYMEALQKVMGSKFQWDPEKDESASAYRKEYLREADRTMRDTISKYSTMTGGLPSTQAVAAASQQADYYKSQLADKMPELRDAAWNRWYQEKQDARNEYTQRISEAMNRWSQMGYADDSVAGILGVAIGTPTSSQSYQNWSQSMQEQQNAQDQAYQQWSQQMQEQQFAQDQSQQQASQQQQAKDDLITLITSTGYKPTADELESAGMTQVEADSWYQYFLVQNDMGSWGGNSGGSSGGNGGSYGSSGGGAEANEAQEVNGLDDLGAAARNWLANQSAAYSTGYGESQAAWISAAVSSGKITEAEAAYLRAVLGI